MVVHNVVKHVVSGCKVRSSRGMGDINPKKIPDKGGAVKSFPPATKNKQGKK